MSRANKDSFRGYGRTAEESPTEKVIRLTSEARATVVNHIKEAKAMISINLRIREEAKAHPEVGGKVRDYVEYLADRLPISRFQQSDELKSHVRDGASYRITNTSDTRFAGSGWIYPFNSRPIISRTTQFEGSDGAGMNLTTIYDGRNRTVRAVIVEGTYGRDPHTDDPIRVQAFLGADGVMLAPSNQATAPHDLFMARDYLREDGNDPVQAQQPAVLAAVRGLLNRFLA